jgi:hypothetical protein
MKKLLLITAMFMAMNTWSADYEICESKGNNISEFESCATNLLNRGYKPLGSLGLVYFNPRDSYYYQGFYRN